MNATSLEECKEAFREEITRWKTKYEDLEEELKMLRGRVVEKTSVPERNTANNDDISKMLTSVEK